MAPTVHSSRLSRLSLVQSCARARKAQGLALISPTVLYLPVHPGSPPLAGGIPEFHDAWRLWKHHLPVYLETIPG